MPISTKSSNFLWSESVSVFDKIVCLNAGIPFLLVISKWPIQRFSLIKPSSSYAWTNLISGNLISKVIERLSAFIFSDHVK